MVTCATLGWERNSGPQVMSDGHTYAHPEFDSPGYENLATMIEREMRPDQNAIIVADDEEIIRNRIIAGIERLDPAILSYEASNGREVLDCLAKIRETHGREPLLIILDLKMPVMDGWEVIAELRREYEAQGRSEGIPIIVISAGSGVKRESVFRKVDIHDDETRYHPMITVAKDRCVRMARYDAVGHNGVLTWIEALVRGSRAND